MAQTQKLEQVLDLLLSENQDKAAQVLHQIIVEKARTIYESIVEEEETEVGGEDDTEDFTAEISDDEADIDVDQENDGEPELDDEDNEGAESGDDVEDRVEDLEAQLAELRAEFDALMDEEMEEPNHADLAADQDDMDGEFPDEGTDDDLSVEEPDEMFERAVNPKLKKAPQAKDARRSKKVDEETQFLNKVADTGQRGTAKLVGTGNKSTLGAEHNQSPYTKAPTKKDYGGKPVKMGSGTGGEYGKYNGDNAKDETPTDNVGVEPKKVPAKADSTSKYTGGKPSGDGGSKSPLSKKP